MFDFHQLDSTENEEIADGVLVRLQSQQMLDQIHSDEPLPTSGTGPVDGDNDSSDSAEDPREPIHTGISNKIIQEDDIRYHNRKMEMNRRKALDKSDTVQNGKRQLENKKFHRIPKHF